MQLKDLLDAKTLRTLAPEELAPAVLLTLNAPPPREKINIATYCANEARPYSSDQEGCDRAIAAAWQHLLTTGMLAPSPSDSVHGWYFITPRGRAIQSEADYEHYKKASLYPRGGIHRAIETETYSEFLRGDYETAVFKAFKAIEVAVRRATVAGDDLYGVDLMKQAFHPETGQLTDKREVAPERESLHQLFRNAIGRFKNPASHRELDLQDPAEVIEILGFASLLMRIVDRRVEILAMIAEFPTIPDNSK